MKRVLWQTPHRCFLNKILHHFEIKIILLFVLFFSLGNRIIPGILRWREMDFATIGSMWCVGGGRRRSCSVASASRGFPRSTQWLPLSASFRSPKSGCLDVHFSGVTRHDQDPLAFWPFSVSWYFEFKPPRVSPTLSGGSI